ncbi:MAG TPA: TetR/AcrR family transcriptional regulator [Gemmatimonadaceae bacterium]
MSAMTHTRARRERRPEERPQEILEAALAVFAERGFHDASLDDVAAAAGVTKGAIYHYFDTKTELLLRAIEFHQTLGYEQLEATLRDSRGSAASRIRTLLRKAFGSDDATRRAVLVMLQAAARDVPEIHAQWLAHGPLKAWQLLAELIAEGQASGEFRRDADADVAARVVLSGMLLQILWQKHADVVPGLAIDRDRLIDSAADVLLAGLEPPAAPHRTRK